MIIGGKLHASFDYTNNVLWYIEDDEKMYILKNGDRLKIYDNEENNVWDDEIKFEYLGGIVGGLFIGDIQKNVNTENWIDWFHMNFKAVLIRKEF